MNEYILKNRDQREMTFVGELIASAENELSLIGEFVRKISLAVYAIEGGGFVAEARYDSANPNEQAFAELEDMDSFDDVDKFFFVFDLYEKLCGAEGQSRAQREECGTRAKRLVKEYECILFPFLQDLERTVKDRCIQDRQKEVKKSDFWNPFKSQTS